jgi:hypothetical protein
MTSTVDHRDDARNQPRQPSNRDRGADFHFGDEDQRTPWLPVMLLAHTSALEWTAWPLTRWDFRGRLLEDSAELLA